MMTSANRKTIGRQQENAKQNSSKPAAETIDTSTQQQDHPNVSLRRARSTTQRLTPRDVLQLQKSVGNRAVRKLLPQNGSGAQARLVSDPEAEDKQASTPITRICASRTHQENNTGLPTNLKTGIEKLSGMAMDHVRVHDNSAKPSELQALAYTQGTEIHVGVGQESHLPHEAWHVVQQQQGRVKPTLEIKGVAVNDDEGLEKEADVMGAKALQITQTDQVTPAKPLPSTSLAAYATPRMAQSFSPVAQLVKHANNWTNYINAYQKQYKLPGAPDPLYTKAIAAATKLDHIGPRSAVAVPATTLTETIDLSKLNKKEKKSYALGKLKAKAEQHYIEEIQTIQNFLHQKAATKLGAKPSTIKWGGLRNGFGTWVDATLQKDPNVQPTGSSPTPEGKGAFAGTNASWAKLYRRKLADGKTLYARGHLLHDDLGGPGLDYNMTPLTAAVAGGYGANHANWGHKYGVEVPVVDAYNDMIAGNRNISEVSYKVEAKYARAPRTETGELNTIVNAYQAKQAKLGGAPTHHAVMNALAIKLPPGINQDQVDDAMASVGATKAATAAAAPAGGGPSAKVLANLQDNWNLWKFEDANVPNQLDISYNWIENNRRKAEVITPVPIELPNSLQAKFV